MLPRSQKTLTSAESGYPCRSHAPISRSTSATLSLNIPTVDLTRFSGHITVTQRGVQNVEERQQIYAGVSVPDGTAGTVRARYEGANQGVWGFYLVDT